MPNKLFLILIALFLFSTFAYCKLTIEVVNLRNNKGKVHLQLIDDKENQLAGISKEISDKKCVFVFDQLKPGKYAFKFIHDENNNNKLDMNIIGIPKEGFNFSNNPPILFGPPTIDKTTFTYNETLILKIKPRYFF